jgi:hypothetical protein
MGKEKKQTPSEIKKAFDKIIKASVKGKPVSKKKKP